MTWQCDVCRWYNDAMDTECERCVGSGLSTEEKSNPSLPQMDENVTWDKDGTITTNAHHYLDLLTRLRSAESPLIP